MTDHGDPLQKLIQERADELGITSTRELTRRAGGAVSYETIRKILRGKHGGRLADDTAAGLAAALHLPLAKVRAAANLLPSLGPWEWPAEYDVLDVGERRLVEGVAAGLVAARKKGHP